AGAKDKIAQRFAEDLVQRLAESNEDSPGATETRIAALRALGALGPRAKAASAESTIDAKGWFESMDIRTRAAWALSLILVEPPDVPLTSVPTPLIQGLTGAEVESFVAQLKAETKEVFPKGLIPPGPA